MPLINWEMSLILTWSRECVIIRLEKRVITNTRRDASPKGATFQIKGTKLHLPVVTLSIKDDNKLLQTIRNGI